MSLSTLTTRIKKTFKLYPVQQYWKLVYGSSTEYCPDHPQYCIKFSTPFPTLPFGGIWRLKTPIDIRSTMNGTGHKLIFVSIDSMIKQGWFTWIANNDRVFDIYGDNDIVFRVEGNAINQGDNTFFTNEYPTSKSLEGYRTIDCALASHLKTVTGGFETHFSKITFTVEYIPSTPPTPATVEIKVKDKQTGRGVYRAFVRILAGNQLIAQGYTDLSGVVVLRNIPAVDSTSYTVEITHAKYEDFSDVITVAPGYNTFTFELIPKPIPPIPWNWILLGTGVVVGGGTLIAYSRRRRT